jgi:hypothetical protein
MIDFEDFASGIKVRKTYTLPIYLTRKNKSKILAKRKKPLPSYDLSPELD